MGDRFDELVDSLVSELGVTSTFDRRAVESVAGLVLRMEDARRDISDRGSVVDGRENPSCLTERAASAELRGWVKERPDLFGVRVHPVVSESSSLKRFKAV